MADSVAFDGLDGEIVGRREDVFGVVDLVAID